MHSPITADTEKAIDGFDLRITAAICGQTDPHRCSQDRSSGPHRRNSCVNKLRDLSYLLHLAASSDLSLLSSTLALQSLKPWSFEAVPYPIAHPCQSAIPYQVRAASEQAISDLKFIIIVAVLLTSRGLELQSEIEADNTLSF